MSVQVECPGCLTSHTLADEEKGTQIRCRTCHQMFVAELAAMNSTPKNEAIAEAVPMPEEPFVAMPVDVPPLPRPRRPERAPAPPRGKKKIGAERVALLITAILTVFLVFGAAGAVAFRVWHESRKTPPTQRFLPRVVK
jgi:hypothetical protein